MRDHAPHSDMVGMGLGHTAEIYVQDTPGNVVSLNRLPISGVILMEEIGSPDEIPRKASKALVASTVVEPIAMSSGANISTSRVWEHAGPSLAVHPIFKPTTLYFSFRKSTMKRPIALSTNELYALASPGKLAPYSLKPPNEPLNLRPCFITPGETQSLLLSVVKEEVQSFVCGRD